MPPAPASRPPPPPQCRHARASTAQCASRRAARDASTAAAACGCARHASHSARAACVRPSHTCARAHALAPANASTARTSPGRAARLLNQTAGGPHRAVPRQVVAVNGGRAGGGAAGALGAQAHRRGGPLLRQQALRARQRGEPRVHVRAHQAQRALQRWDDLRAGRWRSARLWARPCRPGVAHSARHLATRSTRRRRRCSAAPSPCGRKRALIELHMLPPEATEASASAGSYAGYPVWLDGNACHRARTPLVM